MKVITVTILTMVWIPAFAQVKPDDRSEISKLIEDYSQSVIERDSTTFYDLFNEGIVIWGAVLAERSAAKDVVNAKPVRNNYSSGSYKGFMRALFRYSSAEDKFDNIRIVTDGSVASVMMDYSFWANSKMTNWGGKYLGLVKREGKWKISSVIYSIELASHYPQPSLLDRQKLSDQHQR